MDGICNWPRGKVLGGSSVLNAMMYVRGNRHDFDRWANIGNPGWNFDAILPYFKKSEDVHDSELAKSTFHSTGGGLSIEPFHSISAMTDVFLEAGRELDMLNPDNDYNGRTQSGFSQTQGTIRNGLRCSTAKAFLRPAGHRPNLHIALNAFVERILIDPSTNRAYGVEYVRNGMKNIVYASKEIISSAGAIQSPQLLMVSGIGPADHLESHDINVIKDSPGVGENLQDHIALSGTLYLISNPISNETLTYIVPKLLNFGTIRDFTFAEKGPLYAMPASEVMIYINSKFQDPSVDWPDIQIFLAAYSDISDGGLFSLRAAGLTPDYYASAFEKVLYRDAVMFIPLVMRPYSRGNIKLQTPFMHDAPLIDPNYFDDPRDIDVLVSLIDFICDLFVYDNFFKY